MSAAANPLFLDLPAVALPGPRPTPVLGRRANIMRLFIDPVETMLRLRAEHGEIAALTRDDPGWVFAFGSRYNQQVLSDPLHFHNFVETPLDLPRDSAAYRSVRHLIGQNAQDHRRKRRMMMPAVTKARVQAYGSKMIELVTRTIEAWPRHAAIDVRAEMLRLTMDISMSCLFGIDGDVEARELGPLTLEQLELLLSPKTLMIPKWLPGSPYRRLFEISDRLAMRVRRLVSERREHGLGDDVFSALIGAVDEQGEGFDADELLAQTNLLVVASHDTTAMTLCWTLLLLALHPDIQHAAAEEVAGVLAGASPSVEDLERLPLLSQVVDESMRLMPVTPMLFFRRAVEPFELGGRSMPVGANVLLSPLLTHREPELYPDPQRFRPQRWDTLRPATYEYVPFGAGPRRCLGAGFASQAIRLLLAVMLQRVRLSMPTPTRVDQHVVGIVMGPRELALRVDPIEDKIVQPARLSGNIRQLIDLDDV